MWKGGKGACLLKCKNSHFMNLMYLSGRHNWAVSPLFIAHHPSVVPSHMNNSLWVPISRDRSLRYVSLVMFPFTRGYHAYSYKNYPTVWNTFYNVTTFVRPSTTPLPIHNPPSPPHAQLHAATDSNEEQVRIYRSLGAGKTEALTKKCLEFAVSVSPWISLFHSVVVACLCPCWDFSPDHIPLT